MNFISKLIFRFKKPRIIIVTGSGRSCAAEAIFQVLKQHFEVEKILATKNINLKSLSQNKILVVETEFKSLKSVENYKFLVSKSSLSILVVTQAGEIPFDQDYNPPTASSQPTAGLLFAGDRAETTQIRELAKALPSQGYLVLNFDDEIVREIKDETNLKELTFGFQQGADFRASDIKLNTLASAKGEDERSSLTTGTNFKINYKGNIVPIWLEKLFGKEQIYSALAAASVGVIFDINLVEISQALKNYQSLPGKMRLIEGIKKSWILDDSENASPFSMIEALEILGKIEAKERKIAVLGDILAIGKYAIEAHESIGEKVGLSSNLLFTVGPRAKFFAKGAIKRGVAEEKIFQFDEPESAGKALQDEIKEGDLILIDGSKEMKMKKIVEEIKAT